MTRLADGGEPDISITFDGVRLPARSGETLAAALLAAGVDVVARSIYLDRPRGIYTCGPEEPNAIIHLTRRDGSRTTVPATTLEVYDGLEAVSLAGRAPLAGPTARQRCDKTYWHCDIVVIGGGPAGMRAAYSAASTGASVTLVDDRFALGGRLPFEHGEDDSSDFDLPTELRRFDQLRVLTRTRAVGVYGRGQVLAVERRVKQGASEPSRLWHIRGRHVVLATGAYERPLVFRDNDRPGVMLASAAREYVARYGVAPGAEVVVCTTNDSAYAAAADLADAGIQVACILDARPRQGGRALRLASSRGIRIVNGAMVEATQGINRLTGIVARVANGVARGFESIDCDCLAVSGGWSPALQLYNHAGGRAAYSPAVACHVPGTSPPGLTVIGAASGAFGLESCLADGEAAGIEIGRILGFEGSDHAPLIAPPSNIDERPGEIWLIQAADGDHSRHFVDLQRDATVADMERAVAAGLRSPEHVKRYTTIGTGSDQGKTSNVNALGILAGLTGLDLATLSATTARPPDVPLSFELVAGRSRGDLLEPRRTTAIHDWHVEHGAVFEDVGQWERPLYYPHPGESMQEAVDRECLAVRTGVGAMDASTLGKIDVQGPDASEFLDRVYTNLMSSLGVGACRYGLICGVDGMVLDDGVVMRLADDRYVTTTTTGNAAMVLDWMEEWLQTEWPTLRVRLTSVTEQWGVIAVAGPGSRTVVNQLVDPAISNALAFMDLCEVPIAGVPGRLVRVSFSGELAFELHVPTCFARYVWERAWDAGRDGGITAYGTETMHVLRAEKGYIIVGQETDGTVTPQDLGMHWIVSKKKDFFVGRRSQRLPHLARPDRRHLVGLLPEDPSLRLPEGAAIVSPADTPTGFRTAGHVTSSYNSPTLARTFALALLERGAERDGEVIDVMVADKPRAARVTGTVFYDQEGSRRDG